MSTYLPDLVVVIMAGGAGTRFWPVSTEARPKQFLKLIGSRTLLQQSYDRVSALVPPERVLVLTGKHFIGLVREQLPQIPAENVIGEPARRDTAAAVALAALICQQRFDSPVMAVLTADHWISPVAQFQHTLQSAMHAAMANRHVLYTFAIRPTYPAEGYGYLHLGEQLDVPGDIPHYHLKQFREKPNRETAQQYVESGAYCWNSGMFVWRTEAIMEELALQLPEHIEMLEPAVAAIGTPRFEPLLAGAFEALPSISIDFGVMERARDVHCVECSFKWSDVGGWLALSDFLDHDAVGNAWRGRMHVHDAQNNIVFSETGEEVVALLGVRDLIVVRGEGRTLITTRDHVEDIKQLVRTLDEDLK